MLDIFVIFWRSIVILSLSVASDSCKPIDDAVDPDAGSWFHSPCHSHPLLHFTFLLFKVF